MRQAGLGKSEAAAFPFLLILAVPWPAHGQAVCMPRDQIVARLESQYQEFQAAWGMANTGQLVELWATEDRDTWTLVLTHANGISCLMAAGEHWSEMEYPGDGA